MTTKRNAHRKATTRGKRLNSAAEQRRVDEVSVAALRASSNPKDSLGALKIDLGTIPKVATIYQALAHMDGAYKYGLKNWRNKSVKMTVYTTAIERHTMQLAAGEDVDTKSGVPHTGHIMACCAIIEDARACGCLIDDRSVKDMAATILNRLTSDNYDAATLALTKTPAETIDERRKAEGLLGNGFENFIGEVVAKQQERRAAGK